MAAFSSAAAQLPGERLSPSCGRGRAGLELGEQGGQGEKVPGGAAACLNREQEGQGLK